LGIYDDYPSAATILRGGPSLEIGLYAQLRVADLAKSCYMPKIIKIKGGWKLSKALYAQSNFYWLAIQIG